MTRNRIVIGAALLALALPLSTPATGMTSCKLAVERCRIVYDAILAIESLADRDYALLTGLRPYQRRLAVNDRTAEREKIAVRKLPKDVAEEFARLRVCDAIDRLAGAQGTFNDHPGCA
jgi:hypothetical protein